MGNTRATFDRNFANVTSEQTVSMEDIVKLNVEPEDLDVSNEGLLDPVTNFFGDIKRNFKHGKKPSMMKGNINKQLNIIDVTYQNPSWLEKRRFIEGDIKGQDIAEVLVKGVRDGVDINSELINELIEYTDKFNKEYVNTIQGYIQRLNPVGDKVRKGPLSLELYQEVSDFIQDGKNNNLLGQVVDHRFEFPLGKVAFGNNGRVERKTVYVTKKLPALNQEQVAKVAGYIKQILQYIDTVTNNNWSMVERERNLMFAYDSGWMGWNEIERMRNGKWGVGKILNGVSDLNGLPLFIRIASAAGGAAISDEVMAKRWENAIDYMDAFQVNKTHRLLAPLNAVAYALAKWVDRSVR